ncbi:DUF1654 domain-containing protein [Pseudomonas sp. RIT-PI-S]|uniref:DUF1654 domain-containing protein n=1 Tax=Pseudomonas sp. RIT-PI-S TaxID=3035295 RepID=UPI0021D8DC47|nr:DUF1654 domain-containing protein [Pseudomonas sp. RIT-PI-S]
MSEKPPETAPVCPAQRLAIRVSNIINAPKAQIDRRATIHRLDTDPENAWLGMVETLAEINELVLIRNDDGTITVEWGPTAAQVNPNVEHEPLIRMEKARA